jgi:hypothetical protein
MIFGHCFRRHKQSRSISHTHRALVLQVKTDQEMSQRVIVAYLALKRPSACAIHEEMMATLGLDAMAYSTVVGYHQDAYCSPSSLGAHSIEVQARFR